MKTKLKLFFFIVFSTISVQIFAQNVKLFKQFNGKFDFTFIGNTLNPAENSFMISPTILTSSSAILDLDANNIIENAYLYWSGSGIGDFDVKLNGINIIPQRTFSLTQPTTGYKFFSAFADITNQVKSTQNGLYTFSNLDLTSIISEYFNNKTNYAGWAIIIVYKNNTLPSNQINIYDGLQSVPQILSISLNSLNIIDNFGAKIGFVAWEGDKNLNNNETLRINDAILSNEPLNPANNAFNGTNSITGDDKLYNMDLDVYEIQNNINIGDTTAKIDLTSGSDFVMINAIVTKLNSKLPDATIEINNVQQTCNSRQLIIDYKVSNLNSTNFLPKNTPIAIYANNLLVANTLTNEIIPINGTILGQITVNIPISIPDNFILKMVVDDNGTGIGIVTEINETNNDFIQNFSFFVVPKFNILPNKYLCLDNLTNTRFDFSDYATLVKVNPTDIVTFHESNFEAVNNQNGILNIDDFEINQPTKTIFVRLENVNCYSITSFTLNLVFFPGFNVLNDLKICKQNSISSFNFSNYKNIVKTNASDNVSFFKNSQDLILNQNLISNISNYIPISTPQQIFVKIDNGFCFSQTSFLIDYYELPKFNKSLNIENCDLGFSSSSFDFSAYVNTAKTNILDNVSFFESESNAITNQSTILNTSNYNPNSTPTTIFLRIENTNGCFALDSFTLNTKKCPPIIYSLIAPSNPQSVFSSGLLNIFPNFECLIYNRWGQLVWKGNNNLEDFKGKSNTGIHIDNNQLAEGTYFYILNLNDENYPNPLTGNLFLTR